MKILKYQKVPMVVMDKKSPEPKMKVVHRSPEVEEVLQALEDNYENMRVSSLPYEEQVPILVDKFSSKTPMFRINLRVGENEADQFSILLSQLDEETEKRVENLVVPFGAAQRGTFVVNGVDFVSKLIEKKA